jgi:hypothetical protein
VIVNDKLTEDLRPFAEVDTNGHLAILIGAIGVMAQPLFDLISDNDDPIPFNNPAIHIDPQIWVPIGPEGSPGYSELVDIARIPDAWLGYLAQFVGVKLQSGLDAATQRSRVRSTDGMNRGSVKGIVGAAQQHLTGNKRVIIRERWNTNTGLADPLWAEVITYTPETPNAQQVRDDVMSQKPARIQLTFTVAAGQDWEALKTNYGSWQAVKDAYGNWQAVRDEVPS